MRESMNHRNGHPPPAMEITPGNTHSHSRNALKSRALRTAFTSSRMPFSHESLILASRFVNVRAGAVVRL